MKAGLRRAALSRALALSFGPTVALLAHGSELWRALGPLYDPPVGLLWLTLGAFLVVTAALYALDRARRPQDRWPWVLLLSCAYGAYLLVAPVVVREPSPALWRAALDLLLLVVVLVGTRALPRPPVEKACAAGAGVLILLFLGRAAVWSLPDDELVPVEARAGPSAEGPNIYHVVVDSLSREAVQHLMENDAEVAALFEELTFFPGFVANFPWTVDSFAAFLSGEVRLTGSDEELARWRDGAQEEGLWRALFEAGYDVRLYPTFRYDCVDFVAACSSTQALMRERNTAEGSQTYLDFLFLRTLPSLLSRELARFPNRHLPLATDRGKEGVFSITELLFPQLALRLHNRAALKPTAVLHFRQAIADVGQLKARGQYVLVHTLIPHRGYQLTGACELKAKLDMPQHEAHLEQARCALSLVAELVDALKDAGRWDDAYFLLHSDHGHFRFAGDEPGPLARYRSSSVPTIEAPGFGPFVIDATSAVLAEKRPGQREGGVQRGLAHLPDIAASLAAVAGVDLPTEGVDLSEVGPARERQVPVRYQRGPELDFRLVRDPEGWRLRALGD